MKANESLLRSIAVDTIVNKACATLTDAHAKRGDWKRVAYRIAERCAAVEARVAGLGNELASWGRRSAEIETDRDALAKRIEAVIESAQAIGPKNFIKCEEVLRLARGES